MKGATNAWCLFNHYKWFVKCLVMVVLAANNYRSLKITLSVKKLQCVHSTHFPFCYTICVQNHCQGRKVLVHDLFTHPPISFIVGHHSGNFHQCFSIQN